MDLYLQDKHDQVNQPTIKQKEDLKVDMRSQQYEMEYILKEKDDQIDTLIKQKEDLKELVGRYQYQIDQKQKELKDRSDEFNRHKIAYILVIILMTIIIMIIELKRQSDNKNISSIQQLEQCQNVVNIEHHDKLNEYKEQIKQYKQNKEQYKVVIDFQLNSFESVNKKKELLGMIQKVKGNSRVREVCIELSKYNKWNRKVLRKMIHRYTNVSSINVFDNNESADSNVHDLIKQWVQQYPITVFRLWLGIDLFDSKDGLKLLKEYNKVMQYKQHLQYLEYNHDIFGGCEGGQCSQTIRGLINRVEKIMMEHVG